MAEDGSDVLVVYYLTGSILSLVSFNDQISHCTDICMHIILMHIHVLCCCDYY